MNVHYVDAESISIVFSSLVIKASSLSKSFSTIDEFAQKFDLDCKTNGKLVVMHEMQSHHPVFSVKENIVFRTVQDYIVHIWGNKQLGLFGEIQSYNLHTKLLPVAARPVILTEIVGQTAYHSDHNRFRVHKVAVLHGFDFLNIGSVSDAA